MKKHTLTIIVVLVSIFGSHTAIAQSETAKLSWVIQTYEIAADTPEMVNRQARYEAQRAYLIFFPPDDSLHLGFAAFDQAPGIDRYRINQRSKHPKDIAICKDLISISKVVMDSFGKYVTDDISYPTHYFQYNGGTIAVLKCAMGYYNIRISNPYMEWHYLPDPGRGVYQLRWIQMQIPPGYHLPQYKSYIIPTTYWEDEFRKLVATFKTDITNKHAFTSDKGKSQP